MALQSPLELGQELDQRFLERRPGAGAQLGFLVLVAPWIAAHDLDPKPRIRPASAPPIGLSDARSHATAPRVRPLRVLHGRRSLPAPRSAPPLTPSLLP